MNSKSYSQMIQIPSFEERKQYLYIGGGIGYDTFGYERGLNQIFYKSKEWKDIRNYVILRDNGNDLGCDGYSIRGRILIHHIIPITKNDILERADILMNPDNLVCVSHATHNFIHYGNTSEPVIPLIIERRPNDTCPWKDGEWNGTI